MPPTQPEPVPAALPIPGQAAPLAAHPAPGAPAPATFESTPPNPPAAAQTPADPHRRTLIGGVAALTGLAVASRLAKGGPIQPPPGPVMPTGKTLGEVEPRRALVQNAPGAAALFSVTQSGSYYLTGNATAAPGQHGIEVTALDVTVDLNGFTLSGPRSGSGHGVTTTRSSSLRLHNGTIRDFGGDGLLLKGILHQIENLITAMNAGSGINADAPLIAQDVHAIQNGVFGVWCSGGAALRHVTASSNEAIGFRVTFTRLDDCTAHGSGSGFFGEESSEFYRCSARGYQGNGFSVGSACTLMDCFAHGYRGYQSAGFSVYAGNNRLERNTATENSTGFSIGGTTGSNYVARNFASHNGPGGNYWVSTANQSIGPIVSGSALATDTNPHSNISG